MVQVNMAKIQLINSISPYACEIWILDKDMQRRIKSLDMICLIRLLNVKFKDRITRSKEVYTIRN